MNINSFFTDVLGAHFKNPRWSWGARDALSDRVYLRVWEDQIEVRGGVEWVRIGYARPSRESPGFPERQFHLELIRGGAEGFGVVCTARDPETHGARKIVRFDDTHLIRFGEIVQQGDEVYAEIAGRVPVGRLSRPQTGTSLLAEDLRAVARKTIDATQKEALVNARLGQGGFRKAVLARWGNRCAVTGSCTLDAIRASHIKPWRASIDSERLDAANGLPLLANLDALFDAGLISFEHTGEMLVSACLSASERTLLSLQGCRLRGSVTDDMAPYLSFHRERIFLKR